MENQNMKDRILPIKNIFFIIIPLFAIPLNFLLLLHCGGGFRQDSENAHEFSNPLFNNKEFISDTVSDTLYILQ